MEINKEEHKYENLAKEIDHAFYKNCSDCKKCKYGNMLNCRTLFVLDYLANKGYKFKR